MAYTYTLVSSAGQAADIAANFAVGDVMQYAGEDFIWTAPYLWGTGVYDTSSINYFLANGHITHMDGSNTPVSHPNSDIFKRSTVADNTLTAKTKAFAVGVMSTINSIITKINSLTGRVTAVETLAASKAAIDDTNLTATATTLSASKIAALNAGVLSDANAFASNAATTAKNEAIAQLSGVDSTQLATLNALSAALAENEAADGVITNTLLGKVGFTEVQNLTDEQAAQARSNIKFDTAVNAALLATVGDITTFDPQAILATALTLN